MAGVTIGYKGNTIATIQGSGSKTLKTAGKYCEGDISVDYVQEGGGSGIASGIVNQNGTISFYDADGNLLFTTTGASVIGPQGDPGDDYVLTDQDKTDIVNIVLQELPTTEGVLYGNASN